MPRGRRIQGSTSGVGTRFALGGGAYTVVSAMSEAIAWALGAIVGWFARRAWGIWRVRRYFAERVKRRALESLPPPPWELPARPQGEAVDDPPTVGQTINGGPEDTPR